MFSTRAACMFCVMMLCTAQVTPVKLVQSVYTVESGSHPNFFWRLDRNSQDSVMKMSTQTPMQLRFLQPGLSGLRNTVSFEDVSQPGYYVVFNPGSSKIYLREPTPTWANFQRDASFFIRTDRFYPQSLSFEPCSASGAWIRHANYILYGINGTHGAYWHIHKQGSSESVAEVGTKWQVEDQKHLQNHDISTVSSRNHFDCLAECNAREYCVSVNYKKGQKQCELMSSVGSEHPADLQQQDGSEYIERD